MSMIDFGNGVMLNPDHVVSVVREFHGRFLIAHDINGTAHEIQVRYGESIFDAEQRVQKELNGV